jgi:hypothetical protein
LVQGGSGPTAVGSYRFVRPDGRPAGSHHLCDPGCLTSPPPEIRCELRCLYPPHWPELSRRIRFERAGGRCQACARPQLVQLRCPCPMGAVRRSHAHLAQPQGKALSLAGSVEAAGLRSTRVVLAAAHLDGNPANNRLPNLRNLRSLCQRCHVLHDVPQHTRPRWLTCRRRWAAGDLFLGPYVAGSMLEETAR